MRAFFQCVEKTPYVHVSVGDRREVRLNGVFPSSGLEEPGMIARNADLPTGRRDILEIAGDMRGEFDFVSREHFVVLPRDSPGQVRLGQPAGQEQRFIAFPVELFDAEVRRVPITEILVFHVQRQGRVVSLVFLSPAGRGFGQRRVLVPAGCVDSPHALSSGAVVGFAHAGDIVTGLAERRVQRDTLGYVLLPRIPVEVAAGSAGAHA